MPSDGVVEGRGAGRAADGAALDVTLLDGNAAGGAGLVGRAGGNEADGRDAGGSEAGGIAGNVGGGAVGSSEGTLGIAVVSGWLCTLGLVCTLVAAPPGADGNAVPLGVLTVCAGMRFAFDPGTGLDGTEGTETLVASPCPCILVDSSSDGNWLGKVGVEFGFVVGAAGAAGDVVEGAAEVVGVGLGGVGGPGIGNGSLAVDVELELFEFEVEMDNDPGVGPKLVEVAGGGVGNDLGGLDCDVACGLGIAGIAGVAVVRLVGLEPGRLGNGLRGT